MSPINRSLKASEVSEDKEGKTIVESLVVVNTSPKQSSNKEGSLSVPFSKKGDEIRVEESIS